MSDEFMLDVGQANELKLAFRRNEWTNDDVKKICSGDVLRDFLKVVRGHATISVVDHLIDCDADPFLPLGWQGVEDHVKGGILKLETRDSDLYLNGQKIDFHLSPNQQNGKVIQGHKLREELKGKLVLNANVLDDLLAHKELIPESWKEDEQGRIRYIFFWGTIYRGADRGLFVRCLYWRDGQSYWGCSWLDRGFGGQIPAALLAS